MDSTRECAGIRSQLGVYVIGAIAPEDRAVVVRHLAACEPCREELAGLAGLPGLLGRPSSREAAEPAEEPAGEAFGKAPGEAWGEVAGEAFGEVAGEALQWALGGVARRRRRRRWLLAAVAVLLVAAAVAGWLPWLTGMRPAGAHAAGPAAAGRIVAATVLETAKVGQVTVLTDAEGYTLYWFSSDTATASRCTGSCAVSWPPVGGPAIAGDGVKGQLGAIARADGSLQATYGGHPLYTASKDLAPGQARGNDVRDGGGTWHEVVVVSGEAAGGSGGY
jgi:predicted lipoprotein with Yx(FWY)xxD motif